MKYFDFPYNTIEEVKQKCAELNITLPLSDDISVLQSPLHKIHNRLGTAPMEGADGNPDGSPSDSTTEKYLRFAAGGSALIWFEAVSVVPEGRSSENQLYINNQNFDKFSRLVNSIKETGLKSNGFEPYIILQASHSGRYSYPSMGCDKLSDDYLKGLEEKFSNATRLAKLAGFDAVDIKSCHGYLSSELLASHDRPGIYGGSFENRSRFLKNSILSAKVWEDSNFIITSRVGIYEKNGFGCDKDGNMNLSEPIQLIKEMGLKMVNLTMGDPHVTAHITRPYDFGKYCPDEHPLIGLERYVKGISEVRRAVPDLVIWGSAPSYLRQFSGEYAAGMVNQGICDGMLFGRMSLAYPDYANEILKLNKQKCCLTCGHCADLLRSHKPVICIKKNQRQ